MSRQTREQRLARRRARALEGRRLEQKADAIVTRTRMVVLPGWLAASRLPGWLAGAIAADQAVREVALARLVQQAAELASEVER